MYMPHMISDAAISTSSCAFAICYVTSLGWKSFRFPSARGCVNVCYFYLVL